MDELIVYGYCGANCQHRVLAVDQTVELIQEVIANGGQLPNNYTPLTAVNRIRELNTGAEVGFFFGTQAQWDEWSGDKNNVMFVPTNDTALSTINTRLDTLEEARSTLIKGLNDGTFTPLKASTTAFTNKAWNKGTSDLTLTAGTWQMYYDYTYFNVNLGVVYFDGSKGTLTGTRTAMTTDATAMDVFVKVSVDGVVEAYARIVDSNGDDVNEDLPITNLYYRRID